MNINMSLCVNNLKILILIIFISGCANPSYNEFITPSGLKGVKIDCVSDVSECFNTASKSCDGRPYQVIDSWSNAGGAIKDWIPGPFTWYHMQIHCGFTDGRIPSFPFRGSKYIPPKGPTITNCQEYGSSISCTTY